MLDTAQGVPGEHFEATVPGAVQLDCARALNLPDFMFGSNYEEYAFLEDKYYLYEATLSLPEGAAGKRLFFYSKGIDYECDVLLGGQLLFHHEGMFSHIEYELTGKARDGDTLGILIYPVPKAEGGMCDSREEARLCCKSAVGYGWDWHPRLVPLGIWDETGLELRDGCFIKDAEIRYSLSDDLGSARLELICECDGGCGCNTEWELYDADGSMVFSTEELKREIKSPRLWWCHGQGEQHMYKSVVRLKRGDDIIDERVIYTGIRRVKLVMNTGAWVEPEAFPKSRSVPPAQLELNNRRVFLKGSNWVHPDIFHGRLSRETYEPLVRLAAEANFNSLRVWGGGIVNKDSFFELCDEYGILIWQEFPLACNNYPDDEHYLSVLDSESKSIIKRLRRHTCLALWCGGNELFNNWSGMTDQSHALRLLNKNCYELDRETPFIPTSPLMGMAHGCYTFVYPDGREVYEAMNNSHYTAYTEFGVPSVADMAHLKKIIPEDELFPIERGTAWEHHHAIDAWLDGTWLCENIMERYFGKQENLDSIIYHSSWLQCEGYKAIFEEARRQKPYCAMALNWCYCEPWITAANNSIISFPCDPKPAYFAVRDACRDVCYSLRFSKFSYSAHERLTFSLWLLNDSPASVPAGTARVRAVCDGVSYDIGTWTHEAAQALTNISGHTFSFVLPATADEFFTVVIEDENNPSYTSEYKLSIKPAVRRNNKKVLNI